MQKTDVRPHQTRNCFRPQLAGLLGEWPWNWALEYLRYKAFALLRLHMLLLGYQSPGGPQF